MQSRDTTCHCETQPHHLVDLCAELQQFLADFCHEMDNGGAAITDFYLSDGVFTTGTLTFKGHEGIRAFYNERAARIRQEGGTRTVRHTFVNLRISVHGQDHATLNFAIITYSAAGTPPIQQLFGPSGISDCRMTCERDTEGRWRLKLFAGELIFFGNDSFVSKLALS
jgi:SnoaL-like domain